MGPLSFFTTGYGVVALGALAAAVVLVWDWRVALGVLFVQQLGVAALAIGVEHAPVQMLLVQTFIVGLCCVMLAMAGLQVQLKRSGRQSGGWLFRLLVLGLLAAALRSLDLHFVLPGVSPAIARLFGWLGLIALIMLSLGDHALYTAVALLLWCVLGYAVAAFYAPVAEVMVVIGLTELAIALTCSYLLLAERLPRTPRHVIITDAAGAPPGVRAPAPRPLPPALRGARNPAREGTQVLDAVQPAPPALPPPAAAANQPAPAPDVQRPAHDKP